MDWARYKELEREEWDAMKANPITLEITAEEFRDWKWGLMLLRRVRDNSKDIDLTRVDNVLAPLVGRMREQFDALPDVKVRRRERNEMLADNLDKSGKSPEMAERLRNLD
jgi:hypothetical protein